MITRIKGDKEQSRISERIAVIGAADL